MKAREEGHGPDAVMRVLQGKNNLSGKKQLMTHRGGDRAGTNDLSGQACGQPDTANTTTLRISEMVRYLKIHYQRAHVLVIAILPKGEGWPNLCTPVIGTINRGLRAFADRTPGVTFVDPGQLFLKKLEAPKKGWEVNELLMSDR